MNSNKSQVKKDRKTANLYNCKINSSGNKSLLSHSYAAVSVGHKKKLSSLLKNNKVLANALQELRQELSNVKNRLEAKNDISTKMMFVQGKMLHMHSTLKSFVKDFEETLHLFKEEDICWPTKEHITKSRTDFKSRMQNVIDPVEETSERDCSFFNPDVRNYSMESKKSSSLFTSTSIASNSKKVSVVHAELGKEPRKEHDSLAAINEDEINCQQEKNRPLILETLTELNGQVSVDHFSKTPALACGESNGPTLCTDDGKKNSDDIFPNRDMEISATPELSLPCPYTISVVNLNSSHPLKTSLVSTQSKHGVTPVPYLSSQPGKTKISMIPRFQELSAVAKKQPCLRTGVSKKIQKYSKKLTGKPRGPILKSNSDIHQKGTFVKNTEIPPESADFDFNVECLNQEINLTATDPVVAKVEDTHRRETFVQKPENVENSQTDRRKTFVKKSLKTGRKSVSNKRKTFVVSKKVDEVELVDDKENCSIVVNKYASDSAVQKQDTTHSLDCNAEISSVSAVASVVNTTITACSIDKLKNNLYSTEMHSDKKQNPITNHVKDALLKDKGMVNISGIKCLDVPAVICNEENDKKIENSAQRVENLANLCILSTQNDGRESLENFEKNAKNSANVCIFSPQNNPEPLENTQNTIPTPEISGKDILEMHSKIQCSDMPSDVNAVSDQNIFKESDISRKEQGEKLIQPVESNLQACDVSSNEKEFSSSDDTILLQTSKDKSKLLVTKELQIASCDFNLDSKAEIYNFDFDKLFLKDPPIRRHIPKNKPQKEFKFSINKKKQSPSKNKQNKVKFLKNSVQICDEGDIFTKPKNDMVSNIETLNIQDDINIKVKKHKGKKKSVQFAIDTDINEDCISNSKSKTCRNKSSKQPKFAAKEELKTTDSKESEKNVAVYKNKAEVSSFPSKADIYASCQANILPNVPRKVMDNETNDSSKNLASKETKVSLRSRPSDTTAGCQADVFSNITNKITYNQNASIINDDSDKNKVAVVQVYHSNVENANENQSMKLRRKRKSVSDSFPLDDCLSLKRHKRKKPQKVDNDISCHEIASNDAVEKNENLKNECSKEKTKNRRPKKEKVKKNNEDTPFSSSFLVQAEIHPPPAFVNKLLHDFLPKENMEDDKKKCRRLTVLLNDVLQSKEVKNLNISGDKELFVSKEKSHLSSMAPLPENSSNIQRTSVAKSTTEIAQDTCSIGEVKTIRRRRKHVSYKEPSLHVKMRR